jgi:lysophospholipase L1-like esterase
MGVLNGPLARCASFVLLSLAVVSNSVVTATATGNKTHVKSHWVDIWAAMPQIAELPNLPPAPYVGDTCMQPLSGPIADTRHVQNATGLVFQNTTIRQTFKVAVPAEKIRLTLSNAFGGSDLPITAATIAFSGNGSVGTSSIRPGSVKPLTFSGGLKNSTIPASALVFSDPVDFPVGNCAEDMVVTVSLYLETGQTTNSITSHPGSRTTSYLLYGNHVSDTDLGNSTGQLKSTDHWFFISALEAYLPRHASSSVVILGDSITDGRGSTTNGNDRWPDNLLGRMKARAGTRDISVLNLAAGGNQVLYDGRFNGNPSGGPNLLSRLDRDVLGHSGVKFAVVFEGVNDIGTAPNTTAAQDNVGTRLIGAYEQIVVRLHRFGIPVFGATILPFGGEGQVYSHPEREKTRQRVNRWIRGSGRFDAVWDFDAVARNQTAQDRLSSLYDVGDHLHLNPAGYRALAASVDLGVFERFVDGVDLML